MNTENMLTNNDDKDFWKGLLKTGEIAGNTIKWNDKRHYLLGNIAIVGEARALAMRKHYNIEFSFQLIH